MQSVLKFSDVHFAIKSDRPPIDEALGQVDLFVTSLGQANLWSDILPGSQHLVAKTGIMLDPVGLSSDVPPVEATGVQE